MNIAANRTPAADAPAKPAPPAYEVRLAESEADLRAAQRLRYEVFVEELGGDGPLVDHARRLERDELDPCYDHLLLIDRARPGAPVVGAYRLLRDDQAARIGRYYSEGEYDLSALRASGRRLLELGRSCVHPDYRGGTGMRRLWNGLAEYVLDHGIEVMFGVASFHGTDVAALKQPLSWLYHNRLAAPALRPRAHEPVYQPMDLLAPDQVDEAAALAAIPPLIRGYLRLGGQVGDGAYVDHAFNTTDVCLIVDTRTMSPRHKARYEAGYMKGRAR